MTEDSMLWLGCALWLKDHGAELVVRVAPEIVVPCALAIRKALDDHTR